MDIQLRTNDEIRIYADYGKDNFIDIKGDGNFTQWITAYQASVYIEVRKKKNATRIFFFKSKKHKKEFYFDWWADAEVIFSLNEVHHT